jgi:hypothetical protein
MCVVPLHIVLIYDLAILTANLFLLANVFLVVAMPHGSLGAFPRKEGRIQVLAGLAPSIQTLGSLLRAAWLSKQARKITESYINDAFFPFAKFTIRPLSPNSFVWRIYTMAQKGLLN